MIEEKTAGNLPSVNIFFKLRVKNLSYFGYHTSKEVSGQMVHENHCFERLYFFPVLQYLIPLTGVGCANDMNRRIAGLIALL